MTVSLTDRNSRWRPPAEHGAWGLLLVPFFCAAGVAGKWNVPLLLAGICAVSLFLLRGSVEAQSEGPGRLAVLLFPAHLVLAFVAVSAASVLVLFYRRLALLPLGLAAVALYVLQDRVIRRRQASRVDLSRAEPREKRSLAAHLVGVVLLSLAGPATWISVRGRLDPAGAAVWLLNLLFFLGGVLYVKYRVRGLLAHRAFGRCTERLAFAWPVFLYHFLLAAFLISLTLLGWVAAAVVLAFGPGLLRACGLLFQLGKRFPIRRLGWSEVAHSVVFAVLLILAFRGAA